MGGTRSSAACLFATVAILFTLFIGAPALGRTEAAAGHAAGSYYLYGLVCGECDAAHSRSASPHLQSESYAMWYLANPSHRQQMPRGEALSLVHKAKKANRRDRHVYLNAFTAGYKQGWRQTNQHEKVAGQSTPLESTLYQPRGNPNDPSLANLRTLGLAVRLYLTDHNNTFPRMVNPSVTDKYFQRYLVDDNAFYEPGTDDPYLPNLALENKRITGYTQWGKVVAFYEPIAAAGGSRCVLFVDGTVARVPATQWAKLKKDSGIVDNPD